MYMFNNVIVFVFKKVVVYKDFVFYVMYVEKDKWVCVMFVVYGVDFNFVYIKWGVYDKVDWGYCLLNFWNFVKFDEGFLYSVL